VTRVTLVILTGLVWVGEAVWVRIVVGEASGLM